MPLAGPPLSTPIEVSDLLKIGLESKPDEPALISSEAQWTWRELDQVSDRLALHLLGLGLKPGDRVASLMPNRAVLLLHFLACLKAGLVVTPLNYRYQAPEIDHALEVSDAAILLAHGERDLDLAKSRLAARLPLGQIRYGDGEGAGPSIEAWLTTPPKDLSLPPRDPAQPAIIFFTSGSTGKPKGVTHTLTTLGWNLASATRGFGMTSEDTVIPGSSISHVGGFFLSLNALAAGAPVVLAQNFDGGEMLPLFRKHRPTLMFMLPATLFSLVRDHGATREDFRSFRMIYSGGDKVPAELEREFTELTGFNIEEGYGMTEIGFASFNPPSGLNKLGSVGTLYPGYQMSIRDEDDQELQAHEAGRLWIKSPTNMVGYWDNPKATEETIQKEWLDTGDIMKVDEDGYLWFCGRKKQIIVHDSSNICPQEVEEALLDHPSVECAGVIGVHHLIHGENVRAYVTFKPDTPQPSIQELIQFARERVGYKAPEEIIILKEMPLNASGKVDRVTLKNLTLQMDPQ